MQKRQIKVGNSAVAVGSGDWSEGGEGEEDGEGSEGVVSNFSRISRISRISPILLISLALPHLGAIYYRLNATRYNPQFPIPQSLILIQWQSKANLSLAEIATELKFVDFIFILRLYFQV